MRSELPEITARLCILCIIISVCGVARADDVAKTGDPNAADIAPPASDAPLSVYHADPNHV